MASRADTLLKRYREKRDFTRTAEPEGGGKHVGQAGTRLAFTVQKHDARRLHYDFRIEWEGVLKSWAVTKGPSLDPADKRLAVRVEDHPLDYGTFEGTIPAGEYGGGTVMLWDRGWWEPEGDATEGLECGNLKMCLHGEKMDGRWALVRMKGRDRGARENWLLIKERDGDAAPDTDLLALNRSVKTGRSLDEIAKGSPSRTMVRSAADAAGPAARPKSSRREAKGRQAKLPAFRPVQLALLTDAAPEGDDWLHEVKYDGYRVEIAFSGGAVRFSTRNEQDWTTRFASLMDSALALPCKSALIDGEVVAFDADGRADFSTLQKALGAGAPLSCFCFDLLELDGNDLTGAPLLERKALLKALIEAGGEGALLYSEHVRGNGPSVFQGICEGGQEGIVSKHADAPYTGTRNGDWLKVKCTRRQEFVIGGWSRSAKPGRPFSSILVGVMEDGRLVYRGRVGSGFDAKALEDLAARFEALETKPSPFADLPRPVARNACFVRPDLVAEVDFAELTADGQIRHGVFKGLRADKPAGAVVDERVEKPALSPSGSKGGNLTVSGVRISHPDRVVYSEGGVTKGDLARYYERVAAHMLAHAGDRPLTLKRCPSGMARPCFFQKHLGEGFPDEMGTVDLLEHDGEPARYMTLLNAASLVAAVQMGALEFHIWGSHNDAIERPDRLVFDLDPDPSVGFEAVREAAVLVRGALEALGLSAFPMVTGGKGVHVVVPLLPKASFDDVARFAKGLANRIAASDPVHFVATMSKARRRGRIFIDWLRNEQGQTAVAPYSTRARAGAPVATPVSWNELAGLEAANTLTPDDVLDRLSGPDPWTGYERARAPITRALVEAVEDTG
ncbi:DNA ligase D [Aureimonas sp. Leaf324]|uniref:DNA ligase D n=1 Tax=Aureimonas sp. Leaf324 TaxID=1736336 RepID=UPI0006F8B083|nr:DNA ligase D [Aureimonas sp. Leaf324]KQQ89373.1 ATP-dependent DNA ligase [Aureimonas sp. Leaf324]